MIAGTLEIQMLANMARLADDMAKAKSTVGGAMKGIEGAVASAKSALGALGIGLSVGYFVSLIKGSIDAADHLEHLTKSTNLTAIELVGLKLLAAETGTDLDGIAKGIDKMSVAMGKDPEKFKALGITAKDNKEALKQFADIFNLLPDIQQRNALAQAVFNKSWAEMAPVLSLGGKTIGEVMDKGAQLSGVTEEMTRQAHEFKVQMAELETTLGATRTKLVGDMLPGMNDIALAMKEAAKEGGLLTTVWVGMGGAMSKFLDSDIAKKLKELLFVGQSSQMKAIADAISKNEPTASPAAATPGAETPAQRAKREADAKAAAERAKQFLRDDYAARVAIIKIGGEAYAEAIRTTNKIAEFALKEGGIDNQRTREELLQQQQTNTADQIFDLMQRQAKIKALAQRGEQTPAKVKDAAAAIAQIEVLNARLVASEAITQAQIRAERTITAQKQLDDYNAWAQSLEQRGAALAASYGTEREIENKAYEEKKLALEMYLASANGQVANAAELRMRLETEHQAALGDLFAQGALDRMKFDAMTWDMQAKTVTGTLVSITQSVAGQSRQMFELNKMAAMADITVSTSQGIMKAYGQGGMWGTAMAILIGAAGALNFAKVSSTQFGGSGGVAPSVSGAAGGATPTFQTNTAQAPPPAPVARQTTIVHLHGEMFSSKQVRELVDQFNENSRDGGRTVLA